MSKSCSSREKEEKKYQRGDDSDLVSLFFFFFFLSSRHFSLILSLFDGLDGELLAIMVNGKGTTEEE